MIFRKLNDEGIGKFREYLQGGAVGDPPTGLLADPGTSGPVAHSIDLGTALFNDRYEFGIYLNTLFKAFDPTAIANDMAFWTSLGLVWFDRICPRLGDGTRDVREDYRYILSADYRHYYRHLVRSPWQLVRDHGLNARFLLIAPRESKNPLSVHGEILEQFGGRQQVLASRKVIKAAGQMYMDEKSGRPKPGVAGSGRGSARRFGMVLRQFDLTYDPECMNIPDLLNILPSEFERWKPNKPKQESASTAQGEQLSVFQFSAGQ